MDPITRAVINVSALTHNLRQIRALVGGDVLIAPCVKADGYGHGLAIAARAAVAGGAGMLCVAQLEEAAAVRSLGLDVPILVFSPPVRVRADGYVRCDCRATVVDLPSARLLADAARAAGRPISVHVKIDTGMGRLGALPRQGHKLIRALRCIKHVNVEGIYTHFATADADDLSASRLQLRRFKRLLARLRTEGICPPIVHAANSAATIDLPGARFNMVRPGLAFYGCLGHRRWRKQIDLQPAMRVISRVASVKTLPPGHAVGYGSTFRCPSRTRIAIVPLGYGDGYDRRLSNAAQMHVNGRLCLVIGRVSMDQVALDVTVAGDVKVGDEVVVISNNRRDPNSAWAMARQLKAIPYEITCAIGTRVRRMVEGDLSPLRTPAPPPPSVEVKPVMNQSTDAAVEQTLRTALTGRLADSRRESTITPRRRLAPSALTKTDEPQKTHYLARG